MKGHIHKRGDSYRLEVSAGRDPVTGKYRKRTETVRGTRRQAETRLRELVDEVEGGVGLTGLDRLTLRQFLRDHYLPWCESRVERETLASYRHFTDWLGDLGEYQLGRLRPLHIETWVRTMGSLAPATVRTRLAFTRRVLGKAVEWKVLRENPAAHIRGPKVARAERTLMDPEVARRVLEVVGGTPDEVAVVLALGCGLRRSEVFGLRWKDVDLEHRELSVSQAVGEQDGESYFKGPKSEAGRRTLPMPGFVVECLDRHRKAQLIARLSAPAWEENDLVFPRMDGTPQNRRDFWGRWNTLRKQAGLPDLRFHDLRHGYATLSGAGGVDLHTLKELMGHSSVQVTSDMYQRALDRQKRRAASVLDEVMNDE